MHLSGATGPRGAFPPAEANGQRLVPNVPPGDEDPVLPRLQQDTWKHPKT